MTRRLVVQRELGSAVGRVREGARLAARPRRRLLPVVVAAICLAGAAPAPGGFCPCPVPVPGKPVSSPFPHRLGMSTNAANATEGADGSIVVAALLYASWGDGGAYQESSLALGRFGSTGKADRAFGAGGVARDATPSAVAPRVAADGEGRILVAGSAGRVRVVARYLATGEPDRTFRAAGVPRLPWLASKENAPVALALRALADGTLVIASLSAQPVLASEPAPGGLAIARLHADGSRLREAVYSSPDWTSPDDRAYPSWVGAS